MFPIYGRKRATPCPARWCDVGLSGEFFMLGGAIPVASALLFADMTAVIAAFGGGTLLLLAGLALGWCIGYLWRRPVTVVEPHREQISGLLTNLLGWTSGVSTEVSEYRTLIEAMTQQIADEAKSSDSPSLVTTGNLLTQMLEANRNLQARLDVAESTLQKQSGEIAAYISQARTDALTSLNNRRVFDEGLATSLAAWHAQRKPVGVILFDIDHFKILNDTLGHLAGDAVLRQLAELLRQHAPRGSLLARYGGEEFACVVSGGDPASTCRAAEQLRAAVEGTLFTFERNSLRVTISVGVAQATFSEEGVELLKRGDNALYAAKSAGRNAVYLHDGYHCVPYSTRGEGESSPAVDETVVQDFHEVCADLRSRLAQVSISSEMASPA